MEASQSQPTDGQPATSQEQPTADSNLQTPQADQPVPTEVERQEVAPDAAQDAAPVEQAPDPAPSFPSNEQLQAQEVTRQQEKEAAQREHAQRTGGGEVREGELQAQRDEHNARVATPQDQVQAPSEPEQDQA